MIKITSTNEGIIVEGDELTRHYPYNGTLVIPKNSTLVILDESSEMVLFKSASNYDTLFTGILGSISIEDEIVTRENIIDKFNAISNVIVGGNVGLFEVVQSLPTENISDNKVYLVLDSNGSEGNTYVEYLYVNGQWEELGKFKVNVDLSGYATEDWVNSQGFLKEHQDISNLATKEELNAKQDVINDLETIRSGASLGATALQSVPSGYATEDWVNSQGFLKEHQDISNLATKDELNAKQDTINDLDTIRSGASKGATALQSVPSGYATEQWVNEQGFLKEHQNISNLATKDELNAKQDTINDLETIRSGAALGATALQAVPDTYALKTDILSAKTDTRYTTYDVQNPVLSGNTIILQNEVTDSRKYHTLGFDKTAETTEIGQVIKYSIFNGEFDENGNSIISTNFDNNQNIPLDFSHITDDGDQIIIHYTGSFANNDYETGTRTEGDSFEATITYNRNTKQLNASDDANVTIYQFTRSDTSEYIFNQNNKEFSCYMLPDGAYLIWNIGDMSSQHYYRYNVSTQGNLFVGETTTTTQTSRLPQNKNEFFRYENDVKAYILTDKNTTFKTINGQQITGNGNIELATKDELNEKQNIIPDLYSIRSGAALGATALQSVPDTYALKSEIPDISTKQDTLVSGTNIKTINGNSLLGSGDITIEGGSGNVDLSDYYTKSETNALVNPKLSQVTLTQAEYDALSTKKENVLYVISDAENVDPSNLATKSELNAKQDVITDLDVIRSGAAKGATALQSVPSEYATEQWVNSQGFLKEHQDISNLATKQELATKQDTLVSGTNINSINGTSLLGSGNIEIAKEWIGTQAQYDALPTKDNNTTYYITE